MSSLSDIHAHPNAKFCRDCAHCGRTSVVGSASGPRCEAPEAYDGGDWDLVSGVDGRHWKSCKEMRLSCAPCGPDAKLFLDAKEQMKRQMMAAMALQKGNR